MAFDRVQSLFNFFQAILLSNEKSIFNDSSLFLARLMTVGRVTNFRDFVCVLYENDTDMDDDDSHEIMIFCMTYMFS